MNEHELIDQQTLADIALNLTPLAPQGARTQALRERIMCAVAELTPVSIDSFTTVRATEGVWANFAPKIRIKMLHEAGAMKAFLLRLEPGAVLAAHDHDEDEHCLVLEGEAYLGEVHVRAGDYHVAPKGTRHGVIRSESGALLYIRAPLSDVDRIAV